MRPPGTGYGTRVVDLWAATIVAVVALGGCTAVDDRADEVVASTVPPATSDPTTSAPTTARPSTSPPVPGPVLGGPRVRPGALLDTVRRLAGRIGPREATSAAFAEAAQLVGRRLDRYGYDVSRQRFWVPAGVSWGVPVQAGTGLNVIATPPGFDPGRAHRIVGAHLDTVPQAPGAEDNGSGVAVLLELARLAARPGGPGPAQPTVFIAFGAEEPRGAGERGHHFGSRHHVASLPPAERRAIIAMVSLDRVGVGARVPVCTGGLGPLRVRDALLEVARRADVPATGCTDNTASDHWSYEQRGVAVARIGSTPYVQYHSEADVPGVPQAPQLVRAATIVWGWLRG